LALTIPGYQVPGTREPRMYIVGILIPEFIIVHTSSAFDNNSKGTSPLLAVVRVIDDNLSTHSI